MTDNILNRYRTQLLFNMINYFREVWVDDLSQKLERTSKMYHNIL